MKNFRVVIVDSGGSTTQTIRVAANGGMEDAINIAIKNRPYPNTLVSVTATII